MMEEQLAYISVTIAIGFGSILWLMVFLQTYLHFPKMEKDKRLQTSIEMATSLALAMIVLSMVALYITLRFFFGVVK